MSDKFKQTISVVPEFVAGEQPSAQKFTAIAAQMKKASKDLERAIGDVKDKSWPYSADTSARMTLGWGRDSSGVLSGVVERPLGIISLARLIGSAANLNPRQLIGTQTITETLPSGVHEFETRYPNISSISFSGTGTVFTSLVAIPNLNIAGEYSVATADGRIYSYDPMAGGTITYDVDSSDWLGGSGVINATFNVIPDPNQVQTLAYATSVTGPVAGKYTVTLPICSGQQGNYANDDTVLGAADINTDKQLELPLVLTANLLAGEVIPEGLCLLRNNTTNEVYDNATYEFFTDSAFKIYNVDLDDEISNGDEFSVLVVGTDITTTLDDLRQKFLTHTHGREYGEKGIPVAHLSDVTKQPGASGPFVPSENLSNFAPQYLHRDGFQAGVDTTSANDANAMRGPLVLGKDGAAAGAGLTFGVSDDSYPVAFGDPTSSDTPYVRRTNGKELEIYTDDEDIPVRGEMLFYSPGSGIKGDLVSGFAIKVMAVNPTVDMTAGTTALSYPALASPVVVMSLNVLLANGNVGTSRLMPHMSGHSHEYLASFDQSTGDIIINPVGAGWAGQNTVPSRIMVWYRD